jgi:hypothetical protein
METIPPEPFDWKSADPLVYQFCNELHRKSLADIRIALEKLRDKDRGAYIAFVAAVRNVR